MCRQTDEEVVPAVGLPRQRHSVWFLSVSLCRIFSGSCTSTVPLHFLDFSLLHKHELSQAKRGVMVIFESFVRYISIFDYLSVLLILCLTLTKINVTVFCRNLCTACLIYPIVTSYITSSTSFARSILEKP